MMVGPLERVADGVWLVRGGFPRRTMNVYLIEHGGRATAFDSGIRGMGRGIARRAEALGGVERVVLGHAHPDHRGGAPGIGAPVHCHTHERADVEGGGGLRYFDYSKLDTRLAQAQMRVLMRLADGGPVPVAGTLAEGDEVAGFSVIHLPGHAPGQIGLWRERDRLALTSDCFYTLHSGVTGEPQMPRAAYTLDDEQAKASVRKVAALEPAAAWPGHAEPVTGDVRAKLERAAR
jgi:glyoxylase-like metal-dependent hydrolase (beta-lactamase superfamily II)